MQSSRTFKSSYCIDGKNMSISMQIQNIFLKILKSAQNILQQDCLQKLSQIIQDVSVAEQNCIKYIESGFYILLGQIEQLKQKNSISVNDKDYEVLEESLQRAESQVRKHIRIEQQLKLYLDGLEEKNQNLEKQLKIEENKYHQLFESMKSIDQQRKDLSKKYKKLQQRNKYLTDREKLKGHKSAKLISQSFNRAQNNYSVAMYKSKPVLASNHNHSKSKTSQKSFQKQKPQIVIGLGIERKGSKLKHLHQDININIEKNTYGIEKQSHNNNYHQQQGNNKQKTQKHQKSLYNQAYVPTEDDIRIFKQMTKTVQMKQAYKRPVRKVTKYKTQSKQGKQIKDKNSQLEYQSYGLQNRQYRSVSMYK